MLYSIGIEIMQVIDREKAIQCMGDVATFETAIKSFLAETDKMMSVLEDAVIGGCIETIKEKAHWVKGGLFYLHAYSSAEAAKQLELAAEAGGEETKRSFHELKRAVEELKASLQT